MDFCFCSSGGNVSYISMTSSQSTPFTLQDLNELGAILILDTPQDETLDIGIDMRTWRAGTKFKGFKLIPIGVHYLFYSLASSDPLQPSLSPVTGFFVSIEKSTILVYRWDPDAADVIALSPPKAEPYIQGIRNLDFDDSLGAYPIEISDSWIALSNHILPSIVTKLQPQNTKIHSSNLITSTESTTLKEDQFVSSKDEKDMATIKSNQYDDRQLSSLGEIDQSQSKDFNSSSKDCPSLCFSTVPKPSLIISSCPEQLTAYHMDKSVALKALIEDEYPGQPLRLLGELQFTFIYFILGQYYEAFEQWKTIITLIFRCDQLLLDKEYTHFFKEAIQVIALQMDQIPSEFFMDFASVDKPNFFQHHLKFFWDTIQDNDHVGTVDISIKKAARKLIKETEEKFGMVFDYEYVEDAPVLVE